MCIDNDDDDDENDDDDDDVTIARVQSNANVNSVCAICGQAWLVAYM